MKKISSGTRAGVVFRTILSVTLSRSGRGSAGPGPWTISQADV